MTEEVIRVRMVRDATKFPESNEANVPPQGVAAFQADGWTMADDKTPQPKASDEVAVLREQITALGGTFHHKAGVEKLTEILSALTAPAGE